MSRRAADHPGAVRRCWLQPALLLLLAAPGCERSLALGVDGQLAPPAALRGGLAKARLLDLRPRDTFAAGHLPGAISVPLLQLDGYLQRRRLCAASGPLVLVAETGIDALLALPTARLYGCDAVYALAGGVDRWRREGGELRAGPPTERGDLPPPTRQLSRAQQLVAFLSGGVIKPAYLLLAGLLILRLRRARRTPLRLLWHGLLWFFLGEVFCALNFYLHAPGRSHPIDLLHGAGMVAMSALIPWGLFRLLDEHVLHFGHPAERCQVQRLCGRCWKRDGAVRCAPHQLMQLMVVALALLALMPFSAPLRPTLFSTQVYGSPADYGAPIVNHLVELRLYPLLAAMVLLLTLLGLRGGPSSVRRAEPLFFIGFGLMTYPLLRHLLSNAYRDALPWSDFWEELTELIMVLALAALLYLLRDQLGLSRASVGRAASGERDGPPAVVEEGEPAVLADPGAGVGSTGAAVAAEGEPAAPADLGAGGRVLGG